MDMVERTNTHGRLIGLGQAPTGDLAETILQIGFTQVPVIEYVTWTTNVPLTDTEIGMTFGDEIDVLQNPKSVPGIDAVDSSFVQNGTLQVDMLAIGFGLHAFGEPLTFCQNINFLSPLPAPNSTTPVSPDVFTANDVQSGALGAAFVTPVGGAPTAFLDPAEFEWGMADWEALWHLVNAYQFQWIMQQRYLLINELCADVSYFGPYAEAQAAGTSDVPIQEYIRLANSRYINKNGGGQAVPINSRRVGSVNSFVGVTGTSGLTGPNMGVFHPTRDFDLAPTTWGGIRNQGGAACCMPFRKLIKPVLLEKGIPIGMLLRVQDAYHQAQMQKFLSISDSLGGGAANVTVAPNLSGWTGAKPGFPAVVGQGMPELTLDQPPNQFAQQSVDTDRIIVKGGTLKLAILIKGFEIWGPWKEFMIKNMGNQVSMPSVTGPSGTSGLPMGLVR